MNKIDFRVSMNSLIDIVMSVCYTVNISLRIKKGNDIAEIKNVWFYVTG